MRKIMALLMALLIGLPTYASTQKKVLMIIAPENFRDEELFRTKGVLESCGAKVVVVSTRLGIAHGMLGGTYMVEKKYTDVNWDEFSAVVLVGGSGATIFWNDPLIQKMIKSAYEKGKIVAAICLSPVTLAMTGILKGKKATCWPGVGWRLSKYGAIYTGKGVEVSGRIVTAAGPYYADEFGRAICRLLGYR